MKVVLIVLILIVWVSSAFCSWWLYTDSFHFFFFVPHPCTCSPMSHGIRVEVSFFSFWRKKIIRLVTELPVSVHQSARTCGRLQGASDILLARKAPPQGPGTVPLAFTLGTTLL